MKGSDVNKQDNEIKRSTAMRKTQVVLDILKDTTTVAEVSRQHDLTPSEVKRWIKEGIRGKENNFRARPPNIRAPYERKLADAHAALREKALERKAIKSGGACSTRKRTCTVGAGGTEGRRFDVPIATLRRWFGASRRSNYYYPSIMHPD